jgi:fermentation-respiration switch protein FrsA (DUF1100 family)
MSLTKNLRRAAAAAAMIVLLGAARAESLVTVAPDVSGAWIVPEKGWNGRTVILMHGLADDRDGVNGLSKRLAQELGRVGIASLRINFRGEGDRTRRDVGSTFATRLADAASALAFAQRQPGVDGTRIGFVGWSLGAATAIVEASRTAACRSLVVWSSPGGDLFAQMTAMPSMAKAYAEAERTGTAQADLGWTVLTFKRDFFDSFRGFDTEKALAAYRGAFLAIRGTADFLPAHEPEFLKAVAGRPAEAVTIAGADHIFNTLTPGVGNDTRAVDITVRWFQETL